MTKLIFTMITLSLLLGGFSSECVAFIEKHLFPSPKSDSTRIPDTVFVLQKATPIFSDWPSRQNAELLRREIIIATGLQLSIQLIEMTDWKQNSIILCKNYNYNRGRNAKLLSNEKEVYYLSVTKQSIIISSPVPAGQLYGLMTLLQLIDPETRTVQAAEIHDWPKMAFRGLRGHLPKNRAEEIENFKRIIRAMAFCRLNQLWIRDLYVRRFPASIRWDSHPEISDEDALPKSLVKELVDYATKYNVKIMGSLAATADIVWSVYPNLIEIAPNESPFTVGVKAEKEKGRTSKYRFGSRFNFCPSRDETYKLLFDLIDEMIPLFSSEYFDLGIDEVDQDYNGSRWAACNLCKGKDPVKLFADYVNRLADYVTKKGKIPIMNSASFIKGHAGSFHNIYKSVGLIRKNIIINNWSEKHIRDTNRMPWNPFSRFKSSEYFRQYGLEKMIHLVGYERRWKDRPELLESKGFLECYGGCVTHYKYMTDGDFIKSQTIDDMVFSSNHFWNPNRPEMEGKEEENHLAYARVVVQGILQGKNFLHAISNARSLHQIIGQ